MSPLVHPNPTNGLVRIVLPGDPGPSELKLFDAAGRLLVAQQNAGWKKEISLDLSPYSAGLYHLRITATGGSFGAKVQRVN